MYVFMKFAARFVWKIGVKTQKKHFENQKFQHLLRYVFRQLEAHEKKTPGDQSTVHSTYPQKIPSQIEHI